MKIKIYLVIEYGSCDHPYCPGYYITTETKAFTEKEKAEAYLASLEGGVHRYCIEELELQDF